MTDIYSIIQKSVEAIPGNKLNIISSSTFYSNNGISGIKISIEYKKVIYPLFAGFSNESKYSGKLLFGVLKSDTTNGLSYLEYDKDENGNLIQDSLKIKDKFFKLNEDAQIKKLSKWLYEESKAFAIGNSLINRKAKETSTENITTENKSSEITQNTESSNKEKIIDYSNLSTSQWFKIVELPWLITILSVIPACFSPYIPESNLKANYALLALSSLIFLSGLIAIFLTIDKKKQIREALNLPITKNPFTWFISRIGKVICGTAFFCMGCLIILALEMLKDGTKSSSSSSSYSGLTSASGVTKTASNVNQNKTYTSTSNTSSNHSNKSSSIIYYCTYCGYSSGSIASLTASPCARHPNGSNYGRHTPYEGSIKSKYECEYCGYSSNTIANLTASPCARHPNGSNKGRHKPYIGEPKSNYICKYCGYSSNSISNLTASPCVRHPNGSNKGRHSPQI